MPIREYRCRKCDTVFEVLIFKSSEKKSVACPKCRGKNVLPLLSVFGVAGTEKKVSSSSCGSCTASDCSTCES